MRLDQRQEAADADTRLLRAQNGTKGPGRNGFVRTVLLGRKHRDQGFSWSITDKSLAIHDPMLRLPPQYPPVSLEQPPELCAGNGRKSRSLRRYPAPP